MNIRDIEDFRLSDAVEFHSELNPLLFTDEKLQKDVRDQLMIIARDFVDFMGIQVPKVTDVRLYGSNAAYTYTKHSDVDLHILVDMATVSNDEVYLELFNSKKKLYNDTLKITVRGLPVELYMQDSMDDVKSLGDYSVLNDDWVKMPRRSSASLDDSATREKFKRLVILAELALRSSDIRLVEDLLATIRRYRQAGLEKGGEFSPENFSVKALRSRGIMDKLYDHKDRLKGNSLSIDEDGIEVNAVQPVEDNPLMMEFRQFMESSGYIPSNAERNDPRFKMALSVDVDPNIMPRQAKSMGLGKIERNGRPQVAKPSGKFTR